MAELPETGKFEVAVVGKMQEIPNKKDPNRPYKTYDLQFKGDPDWYNTFWLSDKEPEVGQELSGKKFEDDKWGLKFEMDRPGGKNTWNPAAANASVMNASITLVNGFLAIPEHYEMWRDGSDKLKPTFERYINTVKAANDQVREIVVSMAPLNREQKTSETQADDKVDTAAGKKAPEVEPFPGSETEVEL